MFKGSLAAFDQIIGTVFLVGGDEIWVVDAGKRDHLSHLLLNLSFEGWFKNCSSVHCLSQIHATNIPTTDDKIIRVNHRQDIMKGDIDIFGRLCVRTQLHGRAHNNRAIVVGSTRAFASVPDETTTVGNDTGSDRGTIVPTPSDKHHTGLGNLAIHLEIIDSLLWSGYEVAFGSLVDQGGTISVLRFDLVLRVGNIGRVDDEEILVD